MFIKGAEILPLIKSPFGPSSSTVISLAFLSSLTFSVSVVTQSIHKSHSSAKFEMNSRGGGEIFLVCLTIQPCALNLCDWFSGSSTVFFIFCTNRAQSLYLVTAFPSSVHQIFFTHFTSILQMFSRPSYNSYLIMFSFKFIFQRFYDQRCSYTDFYYFD